MPVAVPYKLQIFLSQETREDLRKAVERRKTTLQDLVESWIEERLRQENDDTPAVPRRQPAIAAGE